MSPRLQTVLAVHNLFQSRLIQTFNYHVDHGLTLEMQKYARRDEKNRRMNIKMWQKYAGMWSELLSEAGRRNNTPDARICLLTCGI